MAMWVVDTETTGLSPETDRVVEFAAVPIRWASGVDTTAPGAQVEIDEGASSLVYPGVPIPPQASAVHHLIDEDVEGAPVLGRAITQVLGPMWKANQERIFVAHNARFDRSFLPPLQEGSQWIDTYRCSLHVWPDAPSHGNQSLRYWHRLPVPRDLPVHRALGDAIVTAHLFRRLLEERTIADLLKLTTKAALLKTFSIGDHRGKPWADVPTDFLEWMERKLRERPDAWEPDIKFTLKTELARRRASSTTN